MSSGYRKRRRRRRDGSKVFLSVVIVTAVMAVSIGILERTVFKNTGDIQTAKAEVSPHIRSDEERLKAVNAPEITVERVEITGLTKEEAQKKLREYYPWSMKIVNGEEELSVENWLEPELADILEQVYSTNDLKEGSYRIDDNKLEAKIKEKAGELAQKWNKKPVSSQLESYDKEARKFVYTKEQEGRELDQERLTEDFMAAVKSKDFTARIQAGFTVIRPERTQAQAKEQYQVIGTFTTKTTNNANRNENIRLAVQAIDGLVLQPGEEFSFNNATGNRTTEKGYRPAGAYKNGILIEEPGGGVCQVSTTLYNAVVTSGFETTERNHHSFTPSYIPPGQDAMVSFDGYSGPDLKFRNTENTSVAIRASFQDNQLKISIVGLPLLEEGVKITMRSEKTQDVNPPAPEYVENPNLPFGTEQEVVKAQTGAVWKTYRVVSKDGKVLEEDYIHSSRYKGKPSTIQRNTLTDNTRDFQAETQPSEPAAADIGTGEEPDAEPAEEPAGDTVNEPTSEPTDRPEEQIPAETAVPQAE